MEARVKRLIAGAGSVFAALFVVILLRLWWLQSPWTQSFVTARVHHRFDGSIVTNPRIGETKLVAAHLVRGRILDRDGNPLAETSPQGRIYSHAADYASIVGLETQAGQRTGVERFLNGPLSGEWKASQASHQSRGYDVTLTLDPALQSLASSLLRKHGFSGCIVGIDPRTGEVLCAAGSSAGTAPADAPGASTAPVAAAVPRTGIAAWQASYEDKPGASPFAYRRLYAPGSAFKTLVAAAALETNTVTSNEKFTCTGSYDPGYGYVIHDLEHRHNANFKGHGGISLAKALAVSCNATYASIGVGLGWDRLYDFADRAGFNRYLSLIPDDLRGGHKLWLQTPESMVTPGACLVSEMPPLERYKVFLAQTALGQRNVRMTPLHMALWAGAIANGGLMMTPSVVRGISDSGGQSLWQFQPKVLSQPMSPGTARKLTSMMEGVVKAGTGKYGRVSGMRIAAKTGTPEEDDGGTNAVFIAFAPAENPRLAVAVVIEGRKAGGKTAGPLAAELFKAMGK